MGEAIEILQTILLLVLAFFLFKNVSISRQSLRSPGKKLVLDTCVLIDGRILEIADAGFVTAKLIIPSFIVSELQLLADGQDSQKRERARFGLDIITELQNSANCDVEIYKDNTKTTLPTDDRLVITAKKLSADLCTIDYNLNKVATIEGVRVLNINELANAIRPVALPGEKKQVKIVHKGSNKDQGVGYMEDGSMVVVEGASKQIGQQVEVEVIRYIQTDAGKMLFAKQIRSERKEKTGRYTKAAKQNS